MQTWPEIGQESFCVQQDYQAIGEPLVELAVLIERTFQDIYPFL